MSDTESSLQYLLACSEASLESFELSRLNRASNLRKELSQVAEEWVEAEVSSRLARLIVERRRADTSSTEPPSPRCAMLTSPSRIMLRLSFPCAPRDPDVKNADVKEEPVEAHSKSLRKRAKCEDRALDCSAGQACGSKRKIPATKEVRESKTDSSSPSPQNLLGAVPGMARPRAARVAKPVQAAADLKALDVIASGPPEMHLNLPLRKLRPVLFLRPGPRFASSQLSRSATRAAKPRADRAQMWKHRHSLRALHECKLSHAICAPGRRIASAS